MSIYAGDIYAPYWATYQAGGPNVSSGNLIDDESEKYAHIVCAPKTGTISKIHVISSTVSTAPTADYDIRLETVDAGDGFPTGTLFDTNTNGALTIIAGDDDEWLPVTLTSGASVTRGEILAVVFVPPASPDNGAVWWAYYGDASYGFPYGATYTGAVWLKANLNPLVLLEYSDGSIPRIPNCFPWTSTSNFGAIYSDSTTPHRGNRFKLRKAAEIVGVWVLCDMDAADITMTLYSGIADVEKTTVLKKHHSGGTGGAYTQYAGYFSTAFNAAADTLYRVVARNNYATASGTPIALTSVNIAPSGIESKIWDHIPYAGLFSEFYYTTSTDLSSWEINVTTNMFVLGPIIRSIG